jgi:hypothetical protein
MDEMYLEIRDDVTKEENMKGPVLKERNVRNATSQGCNALGTHRPRNASSRDAKFRDATSLFQISNIFINYGYLNIHYIG